MTVSIGIMQGLCTPAAPSPSLQRDASGSLKLWRSCNFSGHASGEFSVSVGCEKGVSKISSLILRWPSRTLDRGDLRPSFLRLAVSEEAEYAGSESDGTHLEEGEYLSKVRSISRAPKLWRRQMVKKKTKYSEHLTSILVALKESLDWDVDKVLDPWEGRLQSRQQSVILKEEKSWSRAIAIFSWMKRQKSYPPNIFHYNIMLNILGRAQQFNLMEQLWEEMEEKGVVPTNISYTTVVSIYTKAGKEQEALHWFQEMEERGLAIDALPRNAPFLRRRYPDVSVAAEGAFLALSENVETCNAMISVYGMLGQFSVASRVFSDMIKAGHAPDIVTFNTMIKVCGLAGRLEEAEAIYKSIKASGICPDLTTFNNLLPILVKGGKLESTLEYFSGMKEVGVVPDQEIIHLLLGEFSRRDMVSEAEMIVLEMQELGILAGEALTLELARMYSRLGLPEKALQAPTLEELPGLPEKALQAPTLEELPIHPVDSPGSRTIDSEQRQT